MARGWESKSVEAQQSLEPLDRPQRISADVAERERKRASLSLSRRRVVHDLENARTEAHRAALENALAFLDSELAPLGGPSD
ncbi:MAG: hypothetical protein ACRD2J_05775 [Thermoanaerobaculia bacterium]